MHATDMEMVFRLILASVLGGTIGLEREIHGRPAGFRTHLLVSLGSSLFVVSSVHFYELFGNLSGSGPVGVDPGRVAAQVVTGIGFLGAGAIIREKASIRGLTTAACLWVAAAIGVSSGIGLYFLSMVVTAIALISLLLLKKVENLLRRDIYANLKVWSRDLQGQGENIEDILRQCQMQVVNSSVERDRERGEIFYEYDFKHSSRNFTCPLIDLVSALDGVRKVRLD